MFKKSIVAAAVMTAISSAASAADVTLYGTIDTGLVYTHEDVTGEEKQDNFAMSSGFNTASIFGLRGTEEIGGMSVSFVLENSFNSDDGTFADEDSRLFDKEAQVSISGRLGTLSLGRMGSLTGGDGTYDIFMLHADSMDGGYGDYVGTGFWLDRGIYDNMATYQSPEFGGFTAFAQYSFGTNADDANHSRSKDRYAALGATFTAGNLNAVLVVDSVLANRSIDENHYAKDRDDALGVSFGVNYDFGVVKPFLGLQYGKHENTIAGFDTDGSDYADLDGYAVHLGAVVPNSLGETQLSAFWSDGDGDVYTGGVSNPVKTKTDVSVWGVAFFHNYELSSRTSLYLGMGYYDQETEPDGGEKLETKAFQGGLGLVHSF